MKKMKFNGAQSQGDALTQEEMKSVSGGVGSGSGSGSSIGCCCTYSLNLEAYNRLFAGNYTKDSCKAKCENYCTEIGATYVDSHVI